MKYTLRKLILFLVLLVPLWSWLVHLVGPSQKLDLVVLDRTVPADERKEHLSLFWVLDHYKWRVADDNDPNVHYLGYFPDRKDSIQDELTKVKWRKSSKRPQLLYLADTYGVYQEDDQPLRRPDFSQLVYGGSTWKDVALVKQVFNDGGRIMGEYNILGSPTPRVVADSLGSCFGVKASGWTGRYFHELDTLLNIEIPAWVPRLYRASHSNPYQFSGSGLVFAHESGQVEVLPDRFLEAPVPVIEADHELQKRYGVPQYVRYPFWFEVGVVDLPGLTHATLNVHPTDSGRQKMQEWGIPTRFPFLAADLKEGRRFYAFADVSDNPIASTSAYFAGIRAVRKLFYNNRNLADRRKFFWEFYVPVVGGYINDFGPTAGH